MEYIIYRSVLSLFLEFIPREYSQAWDQQCSQSLRPIVKIYVQASPRKGRDSCQVRLVGRIGELVRLEVNLVCFYI